MARLGVIGIVIENNKNQALEVQEILSRYGDIIKGRMGMPDKKHNIGIISLIVEATNEQISALTGTLGKLSDVKVKSALTSVEIEN